MGEKDEKKGSWNGNFGINYTIRNKLFPESRYKFFERIIKSIDVKKILEVGCNRGHNLVAISYCGEYDLYGIDINPFSIVLARENKDITFSIANIFDIPYKDKLFDLVMTIGVLIHIDPKDLKKALEEVLRVSNRYYLMMEYNYDFEEFQKVQYRENVGLWRGNFKTFALNSFKLKIIQEGEATKDEGFGFSYILFMKV